MYPFASIVYYTSVRINNYVLILSCVQVLNANYTSGNSAFHENETKLTSTDQPYLKADFQNFPEKCCYQDEWLSYAGSSSGLECPRLPANIANNSMKSSLFRTFSKFGILFEESYTNCPNPEVWTRSNVHDYQHTAENGLVFSSVTKKYYHVVCSDYINISEHYSNTTDYENDANFKEFEDKVFRAFICSIEEETAADKIRRYLSSYGMSVTIFFLALTFYLYISTPKLRQKVYDKCFICQLGTFIIAFSFTIWRKRLYDEDDPHLIASCTFVALMSQYWFLSGFSWLTVLCIDLWCAISTRKCQCSDSTKLLINCLCAWGLPFLMSLATFIATRLDDKSFFKVDFYQGFCWFQTKYDTPTFIKQPEFMFFYLYLSLAVLINVGLFIHISVIIITNDCGWRRAEDNRKHEANKNRLSIYLKLFLVMGLTWLIEIISFFVASTSNGWYWIVLDTQGNLLQGIFIFLVSIFNTRVKGILKQRFFPNQIGYRKSSSVLSRSANSQKSERSERSLSTQTSSISLYSVQT